MALVVLAGCSGESKKPTAHLRGTVTMGDQPIPKEAQSIITFRATGVDQAKPASATITDGQFDVPNAPVGSVRVMFSIQMPTHVAAFAPGATPEMQYESLVPPEYAGGKLIEVEGDNLDMKFEL